MCVFCYIANREVVSLTIKALQKTRGMSAEQAREYIKELAPPEIQEEVAQFFEGTDRYEDQANLLMDTEKCANRVGQILTSLTGGFVVPEDDETAKDEVKDNIGDKVSDILSSEEREDIYTMTAHLLETSLGMKLGAQSLSESLNVKAFALCVYLMGYQAGDQKRAEKTFLTGTEGFEDLDI